MAPQKSHEFVSDVEPDSHATRVRVPYTKWKLTSGSQYKESVDLRPKWNLQKHSQYFEFSLKPAMPGKDRAEHPDYFRWKMDNAPSTMKPVRYHGEWRGNVGGQEEEMNVSKADWFKSSLDITLVKSYMKLNDNEIDLNDAEKCKRSLYVANM